LTPGLTIPAGPRTLDGSQPDWDYVAPLSPPQGAPNILLILTDNAGFGNPGTFGGPIRTPALDRLAAGRLRYNGFHVTAIAVHACHRRRADDPGGGGRAGPGAHRRRGAAADARHQLRLLVQ
jgi:Sulfatase